MASKIVVKNLKKNFGRLEVLKDINIEIEEGEVVCLIGPSGSGKSTFLRCLNRLEDITDGLVVVDGHTMSDKKIDLNKIRENIGMVFQHFNLFPHLTVIENITIAPVELKKMTKEAAREKAMELLNKVGLAEKAEALEFRVTASSALCGIPLQNLALRQNLLIGCIHRRGRIIIPKGSDALEKGDTVVVVTTVQGLNDLDDILEKRRNSL